MIIFFLTLLLPLQSMLAQDNAAIPTSLAVIPFIILVLWLIFVVVSIGGFIVWLMMLIDCAKRNFGVGKENEKIIWILIIIFTGWIGAIIYYFIIKLPAKQIFNAQEQIDISSTKTDQSIKNSSTSIDKI